MSDDNRFLDEAVALAFENVRNGGRPFGAVVVKDGEIVARAVNRIQADSDPTAHAELLALRAAGKALNSPRLDGCVVYASGQPCPMCVAAMRMSGVGAAMFAYSNEQAEPFGLSTAAIAAELKNRLPNSRASPSRTSLARQATAITSIRCGGIAHDRRHRARFDKPARRSAFRRDAFAVTKQRPFFAHAAIGQMADADLTAITCAHDPQTSTELATVNRCGIGETDRRSLGRRERKAALNRCKQCGDGESLDDPPDTVHVPPPLAERGQAKFPCTGSGSSPPVTPCDR